MATPDETPLRILILDLLVERAAFGHGGNQEIVLPFTKNGPVEIFLVTPQMQSFDSGLKTEINPQNLFCIHFDILLASGVPNLYSFFSEVSFFRKIFCFFENATAILSTLSLSFSPLCPLTYCSLIFGSLGSSSAFHKS